ncbi:MAG: hypothetical protein GX638_00355 [Crenarchaeota archaeon]|nr:hypothetical protein [Thermoproteota archaeon]
MTVYNILNEKIPCPFCLEMVENGIEMYVGKGDLSEYRVGDRVEWNKGKSVSKGGRPPEGNADIEGYVECEHCGRDFFVIVHIRNDIIIGVEFDTNKRGFKKINP